MTTSDILFIAGLCFLIPGAVLILIGLLNRARPRPRAPRDLEPPRTASTPRARRALLLRLVSPWRATRAAHRIEHVGATEDLPAIDVIEADPLADPLFAPDLMPASIFEELMAGQSHGFAEQVTQPTSWIWGTAEWDGTELRELLEREDAELVTA